MQEYRMERIDECISFLAGKAAQTVARLARERLAPFGITPVQYGVLQVLWEQDALSGAEIGARPVLDSATISTRSARVSGPRRRPALSEVAGRCPVAPPGGPGGSFPPFFGSLVEGLAGPSPSNASSSSLLSPPSEGPESSR